MSAISIGNRNVGDYLEPLIIAEIGCNFNGDMEMAKELIVKAKEAGADCVKFQSWTKDSIVCRQEFEGKPSDLKKEFGHEKLSDLLDFLALTEEDHHTLKQFCDAQNIMFSSTPISFRHVDLLDELDVPFMKIASMDLNHTAFIRYIAEKGRPAVLSTGMGTVAEIALAVETFLETGNKDLILLHCTSLYPAPDEDLNLKNIDLLRELFNLPVGYSDHSLGTAIPLAAVALGACVIEKHYTLDRSLPGWDHAICATPDEIKDIVQGAESINKALGTTARAVPDKEREKAAAMRRSIVLKNPTKAGTVLEFDHLDFKRPGTGISPDRYESLLGRKLKSDLEADHQLSWEDIL